MKTTKQIDQNLDDAGYSESDKAVCAFYRATSSESPPARLDDIVLRQAAAAVSKNRPGRPIFSLWRPITFVATLTIGLAIVLQFNDGWIPGAPGTNEAENAASTIAEVLEGSTRRVLEQTSTASDLLNLGSPNPSVQTNGDGSASAPPTTLSAPTRYCDTVLAESANGWWQCISRLERSGRTADAAMERERLMRAFPDFRPPQ